MTRYWALTQAPAMHCWTAGACATRDSPMMPTVSGQLAARSCLSYWPPCWPTPIWHRPAQSTGRDLFHADWLEQHLQRHASQAAPVDVQATLTEFTAASCADAVQRFGKGGTELLVCGGGAFNTYLMQRLAALLPGVQVGSTAQRGLPLWRWRLRPLPGWHVSACWACRAIWPESQMHAGRAFWEPSTRPENGYGYPSTCCCRGCCTRMTEYRNNSQPSRGPTQLPCPAPLSICMPGAFAA